jgi:septum formation protein
VILASASPRRRALLEAAGLAVEVRPSDVDEARDPAVAPVAHARALAEAKARVAQAAVGGAGEAPIVAADTVVHRGDVLFDKPRDRDEAARHLRALAGGWHEVTTAVCVVRGGASHVFEVTTAVRFRALGEAEIARYLATGEADDKAGAYGIQGQGGALVAELRGSYTNVVGLPLEETLRSLAGSAD